ncbi:hypothetical protein H0H92_013273 [Tricholoma furcatifolium]|nr:hypothetical protein H0H92_013273 [Tricholoma furcatifolium]
MPRSSTLVCTSSNRSTSSGHSLSSTASAAAGAAKKALTAIKATVTKVVRLTKKARSTAASNADDTEPDEDDEAKLARLQAIWRSPIYSFFKPKVDIIYEGTRKAHIFHCTAKQCKGKGTICRYQDSKDRSATSNLKTHAMKCFGDDVVNTAFNKDDSTIPRDGSIFVAFAWQGQQLVTVSHRAPHF